MFISVCGFEAVYKSYSETPFWIPTMIGEAPIEYYASNMFSVSDSNCPIKTYTAYQDAAMSQVWTDPKFSIDPDTFKLNIDYSVKDSYTVYLEAVTIGLSANSIELAVLICEDP